MKKNHRKAFCQILLIAVAVFDVCANAQTRCGQDARTENVASRFVINRGLIKMPVGAFLLIRRNGEMGAIRLTSIDPKATEYFGKSNYESVFQKTVSAAFSKDAVTQHGELDIQDLKGPGRGIYVYRPAGYKAQIGKWKLDFQTPDSISMSDSSFWTGKGDHGYEFAPTSACQLSEIDASDKRLHWFRWDRTTNVTLLLSDLPK